MTREQLEQQSERNRAAVSDTIEELKSLSPGQVLDQVVHFMKGDGDDFLGNLGRQVSANPLPVTLIGAGLAWFLLARHTNSSVPAYSNGSHDAENGASYLNRAGNGIGETVSAAAEKLGDMASATVSGVSGAVQSVEDAASTAYRQAGDAMVMAKNSAGKAEEQTIAAARSAIAFCQDQPLVMAGVGLALGAAIGTVLPRTDAEDSIMGEASDDLKENAKDMAVEQLDKAKAVGEKIGDALQEDIQSADPNGANSLNSFEPQDRLNIHSS